MVDKDYAVILDSLEDWAKMLGYFSKASGMMSSLYLPTGHRLVGPNFGNGFGEYMAHSGAFEPGGICQKSEEEIVLEACSKKVFGEFRFNGSMVLRLVPIQVNSSILGVIVFGWVFDHFPDPIECRKISNSLEIPETLFWQAARLQAPTSQDMIKNQEQMVGLLCSTLLQQLLYLVQANLNIRLKDELLAVVSHELKTPLTSILLRVQILKRNGVKPEKLQEFLNSLESNTIIQARLIDDLLDAAKVITGKFLMHEEEINLVDVVKSSIDTIYSSAVKKSITINYDAREDFFPFIGDSARLQQAFWNILSNSIKFTPDGGTVSVKVAKNISKYILTFEDNGPGIDPAFLPVLFEKFSQHRGITPSANAGLGLGLSLVKTIIDMHGGSIEVESRGMNKGTIFEVHLPCDKTRSPRPPVEEKLSH